MSDVVNPNALEAARLWLSQQHAPAFFSGKEEGFIKVYLAHAGNSALEQSFDGAEGAVPVAASDEPVLSYQAEIDRLNEYIDALSIDKDKFRAIALDIMDETHLLGSGSRPGGFGFDFRGGPIPYIAEYLFQFIGAREDVGPSNYAEIEVFHHEFGGMTLGLQRHAGKTPHQLRAEAEKRADELEMKVRELEEKLAIHEPVHLTEK